jgi:hypothetical protein
MAVARQAAATASPARPARPTVSWPDLLCFAKACLDSAARRGGAYITRVHSALNASRQISAGGYARGGRTNPIACQYARGHSRSSRQHPRPSGRAHRHPVRSGANAVRAGYSWDGTPTGEKGGALHISANREKNPHMVGRSSPFVIHGVLTPPDDPMVRHDGGH